MMGTKLQTRRAFLATTGIGLAFGFRVLRAQPQQASLLPGIETGEPTKSFALQNVTIIDGTGKAAMSGMTVVLAGNRIHSVAPTHKIALPRDMQVMDSSGKFLIPGLWDMHIHTDEIEHLSLFIPNG